MSQEAPAPAASSLPLVGMVVSGLGLIVPPLLIVGLAIGVVALVRKKGSPMLGALAVLIPLVALMIFALLFLTAVPRYRTQLSSQLLTRRWTSAEHPEMNGR